MKGGKMKMARNNADHAEFRTKKHGTVNHIVIYRCRKCRAVCARHRWLGRPPKGICHGGAIIEDPGPAFHEWETVQSHSE